MYPTTSPSTSVIARSVRGITSPSIEKPVRPARRATLNEGHPMYASFPIRRARFSPTRCQYWIVPSTPAFSLMSWMSDTRATSSIVVFLLRSVDRVPPPRRGGDETAKFEVPEDRPQGLLVEARCPLERRQTHGLRRERGEDPALCAVRGRARGGWGGGGRLGGLRQPPLDRLQSHAEGLDGLLRRDARQGLLQFGGELADVPQASRDLLLELRHSFLQRLELRGRPLPGGREEERLVHGVFLALNLDQGAEVLRRVGVDRLEQVAHELVERHLDLACGREALLEGLGDPHMNPVGLVVKELGPARLQPELLEGAQDVLLGVVGAPGLLQLGHDVVENRLVRGLENHRRHLRDVERLAVSDLVDDVVDLGADSPEVLLDRLEVRERDAPAHLVLQVIDVPEHPCAERGEEVVQRLNRFLEFLELCGDLVAGD